MPSPSPFEAAVRRVLRRLPPGQTLSYGRVAALAGRPGGARAVVQVLRRAPDLPWWRVVRADGTFAPQVAEEQARRLEAEREAR